MNILEKFYGKLSTIFENQFQHIDTLKNYYKEKHEAIFSVFRRFNISKFGEHIDKKISGLRVSKELAMKDKTDLLVSSDYNSLYSSATAHPDSTWPNVETAKAIDIKASVRLYELFIVGNGNGRIYQDSLY